MSLRSAVGLDGAPLPPLPPGPPYACAALRDWAGAAFTMPPGDPALAALHRGDDPGGHPALDNLRGAVRYWDEHADWMEFLDPSSPSFHDKQVERALYLDLWAPHIRPGARVLDLGGGVGRFAVWLLDRGCSVELVDPDLRSLWRAVRSAAQLDHGALDVHWSTGECLPEIAPVSVALAAEVLCYVADPAAVVANLARVIEPGGLLLCSVEARWGWAMASDAADASIDQLFREDGVVHVPGDRWVQTYTGATLTDLLAPHFEVEALRRSHYALSGPFEQASGVLDIDAALALEARLRDHPVTRPLNRAWMAVARRRSP